MSKLLTELFSFTALLVLGLSMLAIEFLGRCANFDAGLHYSRSNNFCKPGLVWLPLSVPRTTLECELKFSLLVGTCNLSDNLLREDLTDIV